MPSFRSLFRPASLVALALCAVALALWWVPARVAGRVIEAEAQQSALAWADLLNRMVPDLGPLLAGESVQAPTWAHLDEITGLHGIEGFRLFGPDGQLRYEAVSAVPGEMPDGRAYSAAAAEVARTGQHRVELMPAQRAGAPWLLSEAYVPVWRGGQIRGVVEVYVIQQARAEQIRAAFAQVSAAVLACFALLGGGALWLWRLRERRTEQAEAQVRYLARHDALSGTLNRASFHEALRQQAWATAQQGAPAFAVLCLNLDHFKQVNESWGTEAGDAVLREVGARLHNVVRHGDQVARLGGDEFAVLQNEVAGEEDVATLAQRILDVLGQPFILGGQPQAVGASIGAALWGVDATEVEALMHKADLALFRAKSDGRSTFSFYDARLDEQLQLRRDLTRDLAEAIRLGQLGLHFQPLYAADGRTLEGYEALARWTHPVRGPVSPGVFIPLAEDTGLILPLGRWVLQAACTEAARWPEGLSVAVNLSAAQLQQADMVQLVDETVRETGLSAHRLELEVTESLLIGSPESAIGILRGLAARGVRIAMDDFGTGYSSLAYLWRFPFHKLKIDRAFTQGLESDPRVRLIVRSIISLAHALGIRVNAEGVETDSQMRTLQELGCDELQGFLLGRPMPAAQIAHSTPPAAVAPAQPARV